MTQPPDDRRTDARGAVSDPRPGVDSPLEPGRPVVLVPTPPGFWRLVLGVAVAALAPLLGFLWGGTFGPGDDSAAFSPIYLGLFLGVLVGGLGVVVALLGGVRLYRHLHPEIAGEDRAARA